MKRINLISKTLIVIGFSLCLGSIASFISMNIIAPKQTIDYDFIHWQRHFINPIMNYVTIPGIWLFLIGNIGLIFTETDKRSLHFALLGIAILIFVNGAFIIVPTARTVSAFAKEQNNFLNNISGFSQKKTTEDICGGINLLMLLTYLTITQLLIRKDKSKFACR